MDENAFALRNVSHAANVYVKMRQDVDCKFDDQKVRRAFIAGAAWQKVRMCEALGKVTDAEVAEVGVNFLDLHGLDGEALGVKEGDQVIIVIIKQ